MDKREAKAILKEQLRPFGEMPYTELVAQVDKTEDYDVEGESGLGYQVELQVFWDDRSRRNVRVMASIDDGGIRAFFPLCESIIMRPDGTLVD